MANVYESSSLIGNRAASSNLNYSQLCSAPGIVTIGKFSSILSIDSCACAEYNGASFKKDVHPKLSYDHFYELDFLY